MPYASADGFKEADKPSETREQDEAFTRYRDEYPDLRTNGVVHHAYMAGWNAALAAENAQLQAEVATWRDGGFVIPEGMALVPATLTAERAALRERLRVFADTTETALLCMDSESGIIKLADESALREQVAAARRDLTGGAG